MTRCVLGDSGPVAVVSGRAAYVLFKHFGLAAAVDRLRADGVEFGAEVESTIYALVDVAEVFVRNSNGTVGGTNTTADLEPAVMVGDEMTVEEAAAALELSTRRVRTLAPRLGGRKDDRGSWQLSRALVDAHAGR